MLYTRLRSECSRTPGPRCTADAPWLHPSSGKSARGGAVGTWSWEARIRGERGRGGRRSGGRGVEQERRKGERDGGYTVENSLPCPSSTNDRHPPFPPIPARPHSPPSRFCPLLLSLFLSVSLPAGRTRAPPLDDAPSPLDTPPHKATHIQDDSNYVTTSRACDLLPPPAAAHFLLPRHPPPPLSVPVRYLSRFTSTDPTPPQATPRSPRRPAVGTHERDRIHTICGALYIYSAIAASTRQD